MCQPTLPVISAALRAGRTYTRKSEKDQYGSFPLLAGLANSQSSPVSLAPLGRCGFPTAKRELAHG